MVDPGVTPFDLSLEQCETTQGLSGSLEYSLDLFERETATRLLNWYHRLLEAVVADPDASIENVQLLTQAELNQVLRDWNATALDLPFETCLHRLFEEQAARSPDAIAVTLPDVEADGSVTAGELTYAELNRRANRLAHHLRPRGRSRPAGGRSRRAFAGNGRCDVGRYEVGRGLFADRPGDPRGAAEGLA